MTASTYIIQGGLEGRARLKVLAAAMAPTTNSLLDEVGIPPGATILDAGCGGGDVSRELKRRVGDLGRVMAIDFDGEKIALAVAESAAARGLAFRAGDVLVDDLGGPYDVVFARFLLSHLKDPALALLRLVGVLKSGGRLILEDVDFSGHFCEPPRPSFERYVRWYEESARRHGGDSWLGRRLPALVTASGCRDLGMRVVNPAACTGPIKQMAALTLHAIASSLVDFGIADAAAIARDYADLVAAADDPAVFMSVPRIVQCWATKP
jgi:SAM-dependent methyltransferase